MRLLFVYPPGRLRRLERARAGEIPTELFFGSIEVEKSGVSVKYIEFDVPSWPSLPWKKLDRWIIEQFNNPFASRALYGAVRLHREMPKADCIVAVDEIAGLGISLLARLRLRAPVAAMSCRLSFTDPTSRLAHRLMSSLCRSVKMIFIGQADSETMPKRFNLSPQHFAFNPFGIDENFWTPAPMPREHVLAVGDSYRDYETLLKAAPFINAPIRIISGLNFPQPLPPNVTVQQGNWRKEVLQDNEIRDLYRKALCVVVPLQPGTEPSGQSVTLQAMSCGRPVVLTNTFGFKAPGLADGENLLLVKPADSEDLAAAVNRLVGDPAFAEQMGAAARAEICHNFRMSLFAERLKETCRELCAKRRS
jgi:glycosyltransferase involved in cell wall biosynthesis